MAKKKPAPAKEPDLLQKLRDGIERARRNDDTWEKMDGGEITPMKLAIAMVLWPEHKCLRQAGITSPHLSKIEISRELRAAVKKVNYERRVAEIEELVRDAEDGNKITRGRNWIEAVLSDEVPKPPAGDCSECRTSLGSNAALCAACHDNNELWRAIADVRSKRNKLGGKLKRVLMEHKVPLTYLDRIARLPNLAAEFHELAMAEQSRIKTLRDEGKRNLEAVKGLRWALQQSDGLISIFRRNMAFPTDFIEKLQRVEADLAAEVSDAIKPTDARQSTLQMLGIKHGPGSPISEVGRQRDLAIDALSTIWLDWTGTEPAVHPTAAGSTAFVKLLQDTFRAFECGTWVKGAERAALRVMRKRRARRKATAT